MAAATGKFVFFYLLVLFDVSHISAVFENTDSNEHELLPVHESDSIDTLHVLDEHKLQLEKLEGLVRNLSELVTKLESRFSDSSPGFGISHDDKKHVPEQFVKPDRRNIQSVDSHVRDVQGAGAVSVTKHSLFWSERFKFVSAVKLNTNATCVNVLPFRDYEGLSKFIAVGDDQGTVYVFLRYGNVMLQFHTSSGSPITAILSYISVYKNESMVVTGHGNGVILVHKVWEVPSGDELNSLHMETVGEFSLPEGGESGSAVTILEVHHVGRTRYILSADASGKIRVFRENGTVYGLAVPMSRPLAFLKQRLLFLTETGAGSLDLRTMRIRESECEGLNHSLARNYVFDATERSKAYGFTLEGDLIHVLLLGDIMNFKCRVRSKKKFDMDEPLAFEAIKGYLLIVNKEKVFAYNVSSQHYVRAGGPRLLFSAGLDEIVASFLNYQALDLDAEKGGVVPLIASDHEKLVILNLGSGYVGMYRSNLPVTRGEFNTMLWSTPVLFFILFLFGAWHFFANKKEVLTSWGTDDPFTSTPVTNGAPLVSGSTDRAFADTSSRNTDIMDMRGGGGGLRGPSRRYVSPSRYAGGAANSFRPTPPDTNTRPASVDPNFRAASDLKFRGTNLESSAFPKRRESLYLNGPVVDDGS